MKQLIILLLLSSVVLTNAPAADTDTTGQLSVNDKIITVSYARSLAADWAGVFKKLKSDDIVLRRWSPFRRIPENLWKVTNIEAFGSLLIITYNPPGLSRKQSIIRADQVIEIAVEL